MWLLLWDYIVVITLEYLLSRLCKYDNYMLRMVIIAFVTIIVCV
jgi:hypothetical protein